MPTYFLLPLVFLASFILTMVGLGGGLVFAPLFVLLGFSVAEAVSASLFLNGTAAVAAATTYFRQRLVDLQVALPLLIAATLCAPLGALLTRRIDVRWFAAALAAILLLAAGRMLLGSTPPAHPAAPPPRWRLPGALLVGALVGLLAGLLGIGGGIFIVPLLIYGLRLPAKNAAATSLFVVVFSSFGAFAAHAALAVVDWRFILPAAAFSLLGGHCGARVMTAKLQETTVRRLFAVVLLFFCAKLLQRAFGF